MSVFLLGVNYWPSRSAMYMWQRFDLGEIRADMAHIKGLGFDLVRFFLRWDDFQRAPDRMDEKMLQRFDAVMQAICDAGLARCRHFFAATWAASTGCPRGRSIRTRARALSHGRTR